MPIPTAVLEQQYKDDFYAFLNLIDERARYMVTIGYIQHFAESLNEAPQLLDLGCGHGRLPQMLDSFDWKSYVGSDKSSEAIKQAETTILKIPNFWRLISKNTSSMKNSISSFLWARFMHVPDAVTVLKRFSAALSENGVFIVSLWRHGHNAAIWHNIEKQFEIIDSTVVTNKRGIFRDIKVFRNGKSQPGI